MRLGMRRFALAITTAVLLVAVAVPAYADEFDDSTDPVGDQGIPGFFVFFAILILVGGIATTIWKVSTARRMAEESGMDPDVATGMTLLDDNGLSATYLAANLRNSQPAQTPPPPEIPKPSTASASDRLSELKRLLDQGLITQVEYDDRRKAIIDSL